MNLNWDSLKEQASQISLYDIKAGVRKVQNAVMNYTEMEAKVCEPQCVKYLTQYCIVDVS